MSNSNFYLNIYTKAKNNAIELLEEAEMLYDNRRYARAYALGFTALEEISKSQNAADVYTGFSKEENFKKNYMDHRAKIENVEWARFAAVRYPRWVGPEQEDFEYLNIAELTFEHRNNSLFVDVNFVNSNVKEPKKQITKEMAESIIHVVNVSLERIWEQTEYWGGQIGTKGFMK